MSVDPLNSTDLPESVRELVKTSIEQAKQAFDMFVSTNDKTWKSIEGSSAAAAASLKSLNDKIAEITRNNADATFALAIQLAESRDANEAAELQNQHARKQMETFSTQLEEIRDLTVRLIQEANPPATRGPAMASPPGTPMAAPQPQNPAAAQGGPPRDAHAGGPAPREMPAAGAPSNTGVDTGPPPEDRDRFRA